LRNGKRGRGMLKLGKVLKQKGFKEDKDYITDFIVWERDNIKIKQRKGWGRTLVTLIVDGEFVDDFQMPEQEEKLNEYMENF